MKVRFELSYHEALTRDANVACGNLLNTDQMDTVVGFNVLQDVYQWLSKIHFDNCDFPGGIENIQGGWDTIDAAGSGYPETALAAFGALLHTTQDFYAHSNWIELHVDQSPIPVWDQTLASLPAQIVSGTWAIGFPKLCGPGAPTHAELNKDSPDSSEGGKVVQSGPNAGKNLFTLAFETALNATVAQYNRLAGVTLGDADLESTETHSIIERAVASALAFRKSV